MIELLPRLLGALAATLLLGSALAFFWPSERAHAVTAERPDVLDAGPPPPRPCAAEGASPADYRPLVPLERDDDAPVTVAKLREQCAADTTEHGVVHVIKQYPYTLVHCWSGKADHNGFVAEDRNVWSRAVYEGP